MNTAILERPKNFGKSVEDAKASLIKRFMEKVDRASDDLIIDAIKLEGDKALVKIVKEPETANEKQLSIRVRNQIAFAKLKADAFEMVKKSCDLIESNVVCKILDKSRQTLSERVKSGKVLAYTHNKNKFYPEFQFANNDVKPEIGLLIEELAIDPKDEAMMNVLVGFLTHTMDFYGDSDKEQPRYKLIDNKDAFKIIVRDFKNRLEMGK
ncbi:Unknown protein sequence [Pseudomonas caricapapayae]|uniref:Uncharacterized protein n=1 Tax=Pseudomonas caricapapayae TaxID=46678 RepID=A0A0P9K6I3_9PSED|nr:hypothetical protein [Pseudomonas caricapapayae]KAA8689644.1 hypothetical protein F4W67_27225 [Pseudomonas caricapapayae]KPW56408.1 Unknown protein sequence [Pseudomonas caricapapayae]RMM09539.1 hypothetical protein ALQ84_00876 [Pseudomonas caricapapayae]